MIIYTYYQDIEHSSQNELIDLWKISWSRQGYEPIVLNLEDAKKHPYFDILNSEMRRIFWSQGGLASLVVTLSSIFLINTITARDRQRRRRGILFFLARILKIVKR